MESLSNMLNIFIASYLICDISLLIMLIPIMKKLTFTIGTETEIHSYRNMLYAFALYVITDILFVLHVYRLVDWSYFGISLNAALNESALALISIFWLSFVEAHLGYTEFENPRKRILLLLPAGIEIAMAFASIFTHWLFNIDSMNVYSRGPLFLLISAMVAFYMIYGSVLSVKSRCKAKDSTERESANALLLFVISPFVGNVVQVIVPNTPIVCISMFISIYLVFVSLLAIQINHDALTKLNNRRRTERYFAGEISSATPENPIWVFLADVNFFKKINDNYGHTEGDRALCLVADALRETAEHYSGFAARIGGDEFILSIPGIKLNSPEEVTEYLNESLLKYCRRSSICYELTLSIGWANCIGASETMDELIRRADKMQYEDKKAIHEKIGRS